MKHKISYLLKVAITINESFILEAKRKIIFDPYLGSAVSVFFVSKVKT